MRKMKCTRGYRSTAKMGVQRGLEGGWAKTNWGPRDTMYAVPGQKQMQALRKILPWKTFGASAASASCGDRRQLQHRRDAPRDPHAPPAVACPTHACSTRELTCKSIRATIPEPRGRCTHVHGARMLGTFSLHFFLRCDPSPSLYTRVWRCVARPCAPC